MQSVHSQKTEQEILKAAEEEFLLKGYNGARTTSIASKAGVTHAMFHYYFHTKEQLFERILNHKIQIISEFVWSAFTDQTQSSIEERLCKGCEKYFDFLMQNPKLPYFLLNEFYSRPEHCHLFIENINKFTKDIVHQIQAEIDESAARQEIESIDFKILIIDIISINAFPIMISPIIESADIDLFKEKDYYQKRKTENIKMIKKRLKRSS